MKNYCTICVNAPIFPGRFTYYFEKTLEIEVGNLVEVPFGKRKLIGLVISLDDDPPKASGDLTADFKIKEIIAIINDIIIPKDLLSLFHWISEYYHYPLGQVVFESLPKILKKPRDIKKRALTSQEILPDLNRKQREIYDEIKMQLTSFQQFLIHGRTGSGKSLIYLHLIKNALGLGKSILLLLPEINLTPQFLEYLQKYFSVPVFSYHSEMSNSQKFQIWKMTNNEVKPYIILGVRSSIFLPLKNLGLIVVDEEHDQSFKQSDRLPYNARDIAIKRAQNKDIAIVLGSATPTIESYTRFISGKNYFRLDKRFGHSVLPHVEYINTNLQDDYSSKHFPLDQKSVDLIRQALDAQEQVIIFINRLGYANYLQCRACGHRFHCRNCSTNLRFFKKRNQLECTTCGYQEPAPQSCPVCQCLNLSPIGFGTEKISEVISQLFPNVIHSRFDRDEIKNLADIEKTLKDFHLEKSKILIGTQMLSKGHNFKKVNTIIILGIDQLLNFPDFRANERVYQLLTQIIGRAGRFGKSSQVYVQTHNPDLPLFQIIKEHEFSEFYRQEIEFRKACECPPFEKIVMIYMSSRFQDRLSQFSQSLANMIANINSCDFQEVQFIGPRVSAVEKRANKFTHGILLKSKNLNQLHNLLNTVQYNLKIPHYIDFKIDVDPYYLN